MCTLLLAVLLAANLDGESWPGFLGAGADAMAPDSVPLTWSPTQNIAWRADIVGYGQSSPVVWRDRVYVTSVQGDMKDTNFVSAFNLADGKELWRRSSDSSFKVKSTTYVSRAAPTAIVDQDGVIAFFESGDLVALDHQGNERWSQSLSQKHGEFQNQFGLGASPAQTDDRLFVLVDHEGPSYLIAIGKKDGGELWRTARESRVSWSSPTIMQVGGVTQVVVSSSGTADGYDAQTGERLWTMGELAGNTTNSPIAFGDQTFLIGAAAGERGQYAELAPKSNVAVQVTQQGPVKLWTAPRGALSSFASPMHYRGLAYWVTRAGVVYCLDAKTGEEVYSERLAETCWATPLGVGDRVYFFGRSGKTTVLAAGAKHEPLAENRLWSVEEDPQLAEGAPQGGPPGASGRVLYGFACASRSLLLRTGDRLYCVREAPAQ